MREATNLAASNDTDITVTLDTKSKNNAVHVWIGTERLAKSATPRRATKGLRSRAVDDLNTFLVELGRHRTSLFVDGLFVPSHSQGGSLTESRSIVVSMFISSQV